MQNCTYLNIGACGVGRIAKIDTVGRAKNLYNAGPTGWKKYQPAHHCLQLAHVWPSSGKNDLAQQRAIIPLGMQARCQCIVWAGTWPDQLCHVGLQGHNF